MPDTSLGQFFAFNRKLRKETLEHASSKIGIDRTYLSKIELGERKPGKDIEEAIIQYYGTSDLEYKKWVYATKNIISVDDIISDIKNQKHGLHYLERLCKQIIFLESLPISIEKEASKIFSETEDICSDISSEIERIQTKTPSDISSLQDAIESAYYLHTIVCLEKIRDRISRIGTVCSLISEENKDDMIKAFLDNLSPESL